MSDIWNDVPIVPTRLQRLLAEILDRKETVLGTDITTSQPVSISYTERSRGLYIIGRNGTGKSTLLENMIVQDMEQGIGLCVLDPHGKLIERVLARVPDTRMDDVILLDVRDREWPFGLNLYSCQDANQIDRTVSYIVQLFKKLWGDTSWGPNIEYVLRNTVSFPRKSGHLE